MAKTVAGSTTMTYAATPSGTPLAQQKNSSASSTRYFLSDPHSDLVGLVSSSASSKGTTSFDPWGAKLSSSGTETSALGFQSDLTDPDSALVDMGTRWYVPSLGRFSSRDVLFGQVQAPVSLNQHIYGLQNPITMWDPTGMGPCDPSAGKCVNSPFGSSKDPGTTQAGAYESYESGWQAADQSSNVAVTDWNPEMADASVQLLPSPAPSPTPVVTLTTPDSTSAQDACPEVGPCFPTPTATPNPPPPTGALGGLAGTTVVLACGVGGFAAAGVLVLIFSGPPGWAIGLAGGAGCLIAGWHQHETIQSGQGPDPNVFG